MLDVLDPANIGSKNHHGVVSKGGLLNPAAPSLKFPKPPKPIDPSKDLSLAAKHAKEQAIGAYGNADTFLTGGKGLGNAPGKNLWKALGSSSA